MNCAEHSDYNAAIALNNIAVSLMEQSRFTSAIKTFRDALLFVGPSLTATGSTCQQEKLPSTCTAATSPRSMPSFEDKLAMAHLRLNGATQPSTSRSSSRFQVSVMKEDESLVGSDLLLHQLATPNSPSTPLVFFPIQLRDQAHATIDEQDESYIFSVLLYNTAISMLAADGKKTLTIKATQLLKLSQSTLLTHCVEQNRSWCHVSRVFGTSRLVLQTLWFALKTSGACKESLGWVLHRLACVQRAIEGLQEAETLLNGSCTAAAA